jgi:hypothetical protein
MLNRVELQVGCHHKCMHLQCTVKNPNLRRTTLSLRADMVRKWGNREKNGLGHMNDVNHMITTSKAILLKR